MAKLILLRHGESVWNKEGKFTGWTDVLLTDTGRAEARKAGGLLKEKNVKINSIFTSYLKRAHQTLDIVLEVMEYTGMPIRRSWRLNERHYGTLQGRDKKKTAEEEGEEKVMSWRRGWEEKPPALDKDDSRCPHNDPLYADVPKEELPLTESLKDAMARIEPYWEGEIYPEILKGKNVLVVAHGNSLRAIVKKVDNLTPEGIRDVEIPYCAPLIYEFDEEGQKIKSYYLGDQDEINKKAQEIKKQSVLD